MIDVQKLLFFSRTKTKSCTHFPIFHRFLCSKQLVFMSWNKNKQKILYLSWLSSSLYNISLYFMFSWNAFFCRCRCKASESYKCFCSCYVLWCIQINLSKNFFGIELSISNEFSSWTLILFHDSLNRKSDNSHQTVISI